MYIQNELWQHSQGSDGLESSGWSFIPDKYYEIFLLSPRSVIYSWSVDIMYHSPWLQG